ncbi:MAG: hypothetical protein M1305_06945 [Candidatus Marsarchaeota archaeon]|nr:hypothetical protein [Candidatus Marsarchaeota archaeon]
MTDNVRDENTEQQIGSDEQAKLGRWERNGDIKRHPGAQPGNTNTLKHGIYADRFLSPDEKKIFDAIIEQLQDDFVFNKSSDFLQVELVGVYFVKLGRAQEAGDHDAAEKLDRMIRCHLKDLKTTKITREGTEPKLPETTPAEWATALLEKLAEAEKKGEVQTTDSVKTQE